MEADQATFFNRLMQKREQEDYGDVSTLDPDEVPKLTKMAFDYVAYVETLIPASEP